MNGLLCLLALPLLAQQSDNSYSLEKERALGQHLASEIQKKSTPLDNPVVDAYVKRVGGQLTAQLTEAPFVYTFSVILAAEITEPISIPGAYILIPARFFLAAQNEAEFAGMLGHSIAHVALRHGSRGATAAQTSNMASIPLVFMGGWMNAHADSRQPGILAPVRLLEFQRTYELEADTFGLELAAKAGYSAGAFRRYIERTQAPDSKMSPLPARDLRLARMDERLRSLPDIAFSSTDEFQRVQEAVRDVVRQSDTRRPPTLRR